MKVCAIEDDAAEEFRPQIRSMADYYARDFRELLRFMPQWGKERL